MPTGDLVEGSDGRQSLIVGSWAKEKLYYVKRYCHISATGMKGRWKYRVYIDLFSGPGKAIVEDAREEIDGSPLLALQEDFTHYFFNDSNPDAIKALRDRVGGRSDVEFSNLDCNDAVDPIGGQLPQDALVFCFIDPFNWEIHFDSIARLTSGRRLDLLLTFHVGSMKRVAHEAPDDLDRFFGDQNWRDFYRKAKHKGRALLDFYEERLRELKYCEFRDHILVKNERNVTLYNLLYASKHKRGGDFYDKISQKALSGQLTYLREERGSKYSP